MIKRLQLIAVGFIFFGLLVFGAGIYLLAKESSSQPPGSISANPPPPTPQVAIVSTKVKSKPTLSPQPTVEPTVVPVKKPPSSVQWIEWNSGFRGNVWKVSLTSEKWFDTGIPYITNDTLNISEWGTQDTDTHTLIKVNGGTSSNKQGRQIFYFDNNGFSPSIRDTVKLRLEEGAEPVELELVVIHVYGICPDYQNHKDIHEESFAWADNLVNKTKR